MTNHQSHDRAINVLQVRRLGIDTYYEPVVFMRSDCAICRSEGFESHSRVLVSLHGRSVLTTLNIVTGELLGTHEIGLSEIAWKLLDAKEDDVVTLSHPEPLESMRHVRAKVYGQRLDEAAMHAVIRDIAARKYTDIDLSAFITACAGDRLNISETGALTRAMIAVGERLSWDRPLIVDKHSVGGLPGNRTTPIVVAIVATFALRVGTSSSQSVDLRDPSIWLASAATGDVVLTHAGSVVGTPIYMAPEGLLGRVGSVGSLLALVGDALKSSKRRVWVVGVLGIFAAALFYGDSMITPAISVLSAVEGLNVITPRHKV